MNRVIVAGFAAVGILLLVTIGACTRKGGQTPTTGVERYNHGIALLEAGDFKGAIVEFDAVLRDDPNNFEAIKNLAGAYVEEGQWEQARVQYGHAQTLRPDDPSIYVNLAYVYQQLGETDLAWQMLRTAIEKDPNYALTYYREGELYLAQGKKTEAINAFNQYASLEPGTRLESQVKAIIESLKAEAAPKNPQTPSTAQTEPLTPPVAEPPKSTVQPEAQPPAAHGATPTQPAQPPPAHTTPPATQQPPAQTPPPATQPPAPPAEQPAAETPPPPPPPPPLTGDALYQDRLKRGREQRVIGATDNAIRLLQEAYDVHPDYAQVNYELGLAYLADEQPCEGKKYLEEYIDLETDEQAKEEARSRLNAVQCEETESSQGSAGGGTSETGHG